MRASGTEPDGTDTPTVFAHDRVDEPRGRIRFDALPCHRVPSPLATDRRQRSDVAAGPVGRNQYAVPATTAKSGGWLPRRGADFLRLDLVIAYARRGTFAHTALLLVLVEPDAGLAAQRAVLDQLEQAFWDANTDRLADRSAHV
jgi:hypothetical protein